VTLLLVGLYWLITAFGGGLVVGLVRAPLRIEERIAIAAVAGIVGGSMLSFVTALVAGMNDATVLAGPLILGAAAAGLAAVAGDPRQPWRESVAEARERWRSRALLPMVVLVAIATVGFSLGLAHALYSDAAGNILSGYNTVWADWALHATLASNFAVGHNLPPQDPLLGGMTPLYYPFLPDFNSGTLLTLGSSMAFALEAPTVVLFVAMSILVVSLAQRLTSSFAAGVVVMAVLLLGGGLGFVGVYWDACRQNGYADSQCEPGHLLTHPVDAVTVGTANLRQSFAVIHDQPRSYDGLETSPANNSFGDAQQWVTPLLGWWLPQRGFVYGFAIAVMALLLVHVGLQRAPPWSSPFRLAGAMMGLLPLVHIHSLVAVAVVLGLMALWQRCRPFLELFAITAVLALPRLIQLARGPHGQTNGPFGDNSFPYLEPGWKWNTDSQWAHVHVTIGAFWSTLGHVADVAKTPSYWGFWVLNTGILVPICLLVVAAVIVRRLAAGRRIGDLAEQITSTLPPELLRICLPLLVIFPIANLVVTQGWDWDNVKLLVYWQLGAALLAAAWISRWWRDGGWRFGAATVALLSMIGTGMLLAINMLPLLSSHNQYGSYTWEDVNAQRLAAQVDALVPRDAVILTGGSHLEPLVTLAGRHEVVGYSGWLFNFGSALGTRLSDVAVMYRGCPDVATMECAATQLLRQYGVSFVELGPVERQTFGADLAWWNSHYRVLTHLGDTLVYDVRPS
jgi:hypothetical protein